MVEWMQVQLIQLITLMPFTKTKIKKRRRKRQKKIKMMNKIKTGQMQMVITQKYITKTKQMVAIMQQKEMMMNQYHLQKTWNLKEKQIPH